jgi:hypothetical protein
MVDKTTDTNSTTIISYPGPQSTKGEGSRSLQLERQMDGGKVECELHRTLLQGNTVANAVYCAVSVYYII